LRDHDAEVLEAFADEIDERYPADVFRPMSDADHRSVNDAMAGRIPSTSVTRDRVSAHMLRFAAQQARQRAAEYREKPEDRS
jgi:hypothetical protein